MTILIISALLPTTLVLLALWTYGGLGDLIAAKAAEYGTTQVKKIGIEDRFSEKCGTYNYLMTEHGLDIHSIEKKILSWTE